MQLAILARIVIGMISEENADIANVETEEASSPRNPPWQRDELILALDLYFRHRPGSIDQSHPEVIALSELLNSLPIHTNRPDEARFRNPNGVHMKLCNFMRFDPNYQGVGLSRGARGDEQVWNQFAGNRELLAQLADAIRRGQPLPEAQNQFEDDEEVFPEGRILYRLHRTRERNRDLVKRAKERAMHRHGRLACVACGFDFAQRYGPLGQGFIECHHTRPLSELLDEHPTRIEDVALVCSNCHRMVHRKRPWLGIDQIAALLTT